MPQIRFASLLSRRLTAAVLLLSLSIITPAYALTEQQHPLLAPDAEHKLTLENLYNSLRLGHFRKIAIDDKFSAKLFDKYLEQLDKNHLYFLASDIDEFKPQRLHLDEALNNDDLSFAYQVFNRFQQRSRERIDFLLSELKKGLNNYNFDTKEVLQTDRSNAPWATSSAELDKLWRKRLKIAVLNFKLADKSLAEATDILTKRYESQLNRLDQINNTDVFQAYANALTALYGPHTQYFSPRKSENFDIDMRLSLEGIGAVLQSEYENTKIVRLIPAGPADKTGALHPNDLIVGVGQGKDGEMVNVVGWRLDEVVDKIRGPKGSTVRLQVIPANSKNKLTKEVVIVRNTVKLEEQAAQKDIIHVKRNGKDHKLGLIRIPTFYVDFAALRNGDPNYRSTTRDVEKLAHELMKEGVEGLVIDLRNNGGGALKEAIDLAGLFIPQGPVVQIKDSWGQVRVEFDHDPKYIDIPLVVMVNRLSASASEIFAGAIKDYHRGLIIGSPTFGKGTVQILHPLNAGQLKLTRAKFYRVNGASTQLKGVMPDIRLPSLFDASEIGESHADEALPWDQVKPLPHLEYPQFDKLLPTLEKDHEQRVKHEADYTTLVEQIDYQHKKNLDKTVPLNETVLREQRQEEENWQLKLQNQVRASKHEAPLKDVAALEKSMEKPHEAKPEDDVLLREGGQILLDLINLSPNQTTAVAKQ